MEFRQTGSGLLKKIKSGSKKILEKGRNVVMKNSKSIKGKQILLLGLVALVLVAGYYRWTVDTGGETVPVISDSIGDEIDKIDIEEENIDENMNYFEKSKYERDLKRSEAISMLQDAAENNEEGEISEDAEKKIEEAAVKSEKESIIENLIISKGFNDCVVFMDEDIINVVVEAESLDIKSVNQIKDIILTQTDYKAPQIRISSKQK